MKCGKVLRIKVLGYADDLALVDTTVDERPSVRAFFYVAYHHVDVL